MAIDPQASRKTGFPQRPQLAKETAAQAPILGSAQAGRKGIEKMRPAWAERADDHGRKEYCLIQPLRGCREGRSTLFLVVVTGPRLTSPRANRKSGAVGVPSRK
jgi:hypothetical protein